MAPQPLARVKPVADIALGPGALPARPQLAALVAQVIAFWSEVELQRGRYLGALLGDSGHASVATYLSIRSGRDRREALDAASQRVLSIDEYNLFTRIMKAAQTAEKERNTFAHGLWGYSDTLPEGLLLVEPTYRLDDLVRMDFLLQQMRAGTIQWPVGRIEFDRTKIMVYREPDLKRTLRSVSAAHRLMYYLARLPGLDGHGREELRLQLLRDVSRARPWPLR